MKKIILAIVVLVSIIVILSACFYYYANEKLSQKVPLKSDLIITIPHGTSLIHCVEMLNENKLFEPGWFFGFYFRIYSKLINRHINAGTYKFTSGMDNQSVLESLFNGDNQYVLKVTYPEGITLKKFAEITEKKFGIPKNDFVKYVNSPEVLQRFGINASSAEGYLLPDTYIYFFNAGLETVANRLLQEHQKIREEKFEQKIKSSGFSLHQILTLASIIEAETPVISERKRVSGVYHNRLKKKMLLQADPTVAYFLNEKKFLTYRDLKIRNLYNTYIIPGLPPGPINSPSISSIEAALEPELHDYFYFVARGDSSMQHNFSKTYREHLNSVNKYRKNLRKQRVDTK